MMERIEIELKLSNLCGCTHTVHADCKPCILCINDRSDRCDQRIARNHEGCAKIDHYGVLIGFGLINVKTAKIRLVAGLTVDSDEIVILKAFLTRKD